MIERPPIGIVGVGKVGVTLALMAKRRGYSVVLGARDSEKASRLIESFDEELTVVSMTQCAKESDFVILSVSDNAILAVCTLLSENRCLGTGKVLVHCSGALDKKVLEPASKCGCHVGSMHPLQTFPSVEAALKRLAGTHWFYEGDQEILSAMVSLIEHLEGVPVKIETGAKMMYHAGAVFACNYLSSLMDMALASGEAAGLPRATYFRALRPLIDATLTNIESQGAAKALTGPLARGDANTIESHLEAFRESAPALLPAYRELGLWTVSLALEKGAIDAKTARTLRNVLSSSN